MSRPTPALRMLLFAMLTSCGLLSQIATAAAAQGETTPGAALKHDKGDDAPNEGCGALPDAGKLKELLKQAPVEGEVGGFAGGRFEWAAVVDRDGTLCALAVSTDDPSAAWPGSRAIAIAKAFTANAFSSDTKPMSTARLYTMSLPGHSLWGAGNGNPFNPACMGAPDAAAPTGKVCGGTIVFGGGVPLYRDKKRIGGLGASGDSPCADHEIAKRMRHGAGLDPDKGASADDITYAKVDGPTLFTHPLCHNTWRNGKKIGEEPAGMKH